MVLLIDCISFQCAKSFVKDSVVILNGTEDVKKMAEKMEERRKQAKLSKVNAEITTNTTCNHWIIHTVEREKSKWNKNQLVMDGYLRLQLYIL